jgi:hypothetical protein
MVLDIAQYKFRFRGNGRAFTPTQVVIDNHAMAGGKKFGSDHTANVTRPTCHQ